MNKKKKNQHEVHQSSYIEKPMHEVKILNYHVFLLSLFAFTATKQLISLSTS